MFSTIILKQKIHFITTIVDNLICNGINQLFQGNKTTVTSKSNNPSSVYYPPTKFPHFIQCYTTCTAEQND